MKVHGINLSPFVRKVLVTLELKQMDYENIAVLPGNTEPDYLKISPLGKIPALEDGDQAMADSSIICEYLDEQYPQHATRPTSAADRAKARWLEEFGDSKLAENCGGIFFERAVKPLMMKEAADEDRINTIITETLPPLFDYLNGELPTEGFLFGDTLTTADVAAISPVINAQYAGFVVDSDRWPAIAGFVERVKQHPAVAKVLAAEQETMASLAG